jgi:hypothetical protein
MSNLFYPAFKERLLRAYFLGESPSGDVAVQVVLVGPAFNYDVNHDSLSQVLGVLTDPVTIENADVAGGFFTGDDLTPGWDALTLGTEVKGFLIFAAYNDGTDDLTELMLFVDTSRDGSLPLVVSSPALNIRWDEFVFAL